MQPMTYPSMPSTLFQSESTSFDLVEESEAAVGSAFYPHRTTAARVEERFQGKLTLHRLGSILVGEIDYNSAIAMECPDIPGSYHLNVPVDGKISSRTTGHDELRMTSRRAALYSEGSNAILSSELPFHMIAVRFDGAELERTLTAMIGRPVRLGIELDAELDLSAGLAKQWWNLLAGVRHQLNSGCNELLSVPAVAEPLSHSLMSGFLLAARHQFSGQLHSEADAATPASIKLVRDRIEDRLGEPILLSDIAAGTGLSVRTIQRGFIEHLGVTPSEYIRAARLRHAHLELLAGDPSTTLVAEVAMRWGFGHLGRFAAHYKRMFGVSPSETLRL